MTSSLGPTDENRSNKHREDAQECEKAATPSLSAGRELATYSPHRCTIRGATSGLIAKVFDTLAPEICELLLPCIIPALGMGETLTESQVLSKIDCDTPYTLVARHSYRLSPGDVQPQGREITIWCRNEEILMPELSLALNAGRIDLSFAFDSSKDTDLWEWADKIGEIVGIDSLSKRFVESAIADSAQPDGRMQVQIAESVFLEAMPVDLRSSHASDTSNHGAFPVISKDSIWIPREIQLMDASYTDHKTVAHFVDPMSGLSLHESGLLRFGAALTEHAETKISERSLERIAKALPISLLLQVSRCIHLGYDSDMPVLTDREEAASSGTGRAYDEVHLDSEDRLLDGDSTLDDPDEFQDEDEYDEETIPEPPRSTTSVMISGLTGAIGEYSIGFLSHPELNGSINYEVDDWVSEESIENPDAQSYQVLRLVFTPPLTEAPLALTENSRWRLIVALSQALHLQGIDELNNLRPNFESLAAECAHTGASTDEFSLNYIVDRLLVCFQRGTLD